MQLTNRIKARGSVPPFLCVAVTPPMRERPTAVHPCLCPRQTIAKRDHPRALFRLPGRHARSTPRTPLVRWVWDRQLSLDVIRRAIRTRFDRYRMLRTLLTSNIGYGFGLRHASRRPSPILTHVPWSQSKKNLSPLGSWGASWSSIRQGTSCALMLSSCAWPCLRFLGVPRRNCNCQYSS